MSYTLPYTETEAIVSLSESIEEKLYELEPIARYILPAARKNHLITSISATLNIEEIEATKPKIRKVMQKKAEHLAKEEVQAITNTWKAYELLPELDPASLEDFFLLHAVLMENLVARPGKIRLKSEGVFEEGRLIHLAPPSELVYGQLKELFLWYKRSTLPVWIKSSLFHGELEFIHPFEDGNGRMGRLWQRLMLAKEYPLFYWLSIEEILCFKREDYYKHLHQAEAEGEDSFFVEFMLEAIDSALYLAINQARYSYHRSPWRLIDEMKEDQPLSASELMKLLGESSRSALFNFYIKPALEMGLIEYTCPERPASRNQKYRKVKESRIR